MSILRNRHLITAMFVTPLLALGGYYIADRSVAEPPVAIQPGQSYPLVARSNCRYQSGQCTLVNGEVKLTVSSRRLSENQVELTLNTEQPVEKAIIASVDDDEQEKPVAMIRDGNLWKNELIITDPAATHLRMAFTLKGAHFFVETPAVFIDHETGFSRESFPEKT